MASVPNLPLPLQGPPALRGDDPLNTLQRRIGAVACLEFLPLWAEPFLQGGCDRSHQLAQELRESPREVVITRLDIPFMNLLVFFIKAGLASIPAAIIVGIIYGIIYMVVAGIFMGGMGGRHW